MKKFSISAFFLFVLSFSGVLFAAPNYPFCGQNHCSAADAQIKQTCDLNGWGQGVKVVTAKHGNPCYCWCSCLAYNTKVLIGSGKELPIEKISVGSKVLVLSNGKLIPKKVKVSRGTPDNIHHDYAIQVTFGNKYIISSPDHLYYVKDNRTNSFVLLRADRLNPATYSLVSKTLKPIKIDTVAHGSWNGGLWHISVDTKSKGKNERLIVTEGVLSGDYFLQSNYSKLPVLLAQPQIGSMKYISSNPNYLNMLKQVKSSFSRSAFKVFTPFKPPSNARPFLPPSAEQPAPSSLRALDDHFARQKAEQIMALFSGFYSDINFSMDWNDNRVNAYAWKQGSKKYVKMLGGLVRNIHVDYQAIALVFSHEVGHHYGGSPTFPHGLSCEGQSDYWASLVSMRKVYPGYEYLMVMKEAIRQIYNMFTQGLLKYPTGSIAGANKACEHPNADCRKLTYEAGVELKPKPKCATFSKPSITTPTACNPISCQGIIQKACKNNKLSKGTTLPEVRNGIVCYCQCE